jgi:hypothetical protein
MADLDRTRCSLTSPKRLRLRLFSSPPPPTTKKDKSQGLWNPPTGATAGKQGTATRRKRQPATASTGPIKIAKH